MIPGAQINECTTLSSGRESLLNNDVELDEASLCVCPSLFSVAAINTPTSGTNVFGGVDFLVPMSLGVDFLLL